MQSFIHKEKSHKTPKFVLFLLIVVRIVVVQEPLKLLTTDVLVLGLILMVVSSNGLFVY